ncbi:unnamed protein product [Meloidogyne enterolobii]|uniref:Uncharacterized protein n=4 Tax=Meloidogyne enterolobii TaxID=390850 RepID=A0ACB0YTF5_MELEN|nr:unnamed protein product [Meloidogyne enterolobii]
MCSIPDGTYEIKIGETFLRGDKNNKSSKAEFNTLRFDFKPASITDGSEAFLAISSGENNGVQVIVPGETKKSTIFHGSKKPLKGDKECLLIFDQNTCQLRLEKLSANINVKKSRDAKLSTDVEEQIEKMMKLKAPPPSPIKIKEEIKKERLFSTSSNSMNEEEEEDDEDMFDVDEEASALEQMMAPKQSNSHISVAEQQPLLNSIKVEQSSIKIEAISPQKMANNGQNLTENIKKSPSKNNKKSILHEDLELSESSSSEESEEEGEESD